LRSATIKSIKHHSIGDSHYRENSLKKYRGIDKPMLSPSPSQLRAFKDSELISSTQKLVREERSVTMSVLRHLAEIERRKLYCDYRCGSLFEYAVKELKYSEGAASRRIQAVRLLSELPELAPKIESGVLNLSNVSQAQGFFREQKKADPQQPLGREAKKEILQQLEQKSAREGQRILLAIGGPTALPQESARVVSPEHLEVRFLINSELKAELETVRSLLGPRGMNLSLAELVLEMARLSAARLTEKRFGKQRVRAAERETLVAERPKPGTTGGNPDVGVKADGIQTNHHHFTVKPFGPQQPQQDPTQPSILNPSGLNPSLLRRTRYIPAAVKHQVWAQAHGKCTHCDSQRNLQFDHCEPFALGGTSQPENLRLLCQACNLRRGVQTFGAHAMRRT
jgi:hypothetical protein